MTGNLRKLVLAATLALSSHGFGAFDCPLVEGQENGDRMALIFYAAGYTEGERAMYEADVDQAIQEIHGASPFREYWGHLRFYRAWTPSLRSGVLDAPSDSVFGGVYLLDGAPRWNSDGFWKRYGDSSFACAGKNQNFILSNRGIFLLNSYADGGVTVGHNWTLQSRLHWGTLIHELGHAVGELSDEYGGFPGRPSSTWASDGTSYGPVYNVSRSTRKEQIPWKAWIADSTPIPTPEDPQHFDDIGVFRGGDYQDTGVYHPSARCRMFRSANDDFCNVCREALAHHILSYTKGYFFNRLGLDTVIPIPSISKWDSVVVTGGKVVVRRLPGDTVPISLRWRLNGAWLAGVRETLDVASLPANGALEAILEAASPFIRNPELVPRDTFHWSIHRPSGISGNRERMDRIRRLGPALFLVPFDGTIPRWVRRADGRRLPLEVVARAADGWLVRGGRDLAEVLFLDSPEPMSETERGDR